MPVLTSSQGTLHFGRVAEILVTTAQTGNPVLVTIEQFRLADARHPVLRMPMLFRAPNITLVAVPSVRHSVFC